LPVCLSVLSIPTSCRDIKEQHFTSFPSTDQIVDEGINKSDKDNGENSHQDVLVSNEENNELDHNLAESILATHNGKAATIENCTEHTSVLLPNTSSLNNCPSISALTCTHYEVLMSLPTPPTMVSLGLDPGECNSDLHHQVYPSATSVHSNNKGESSGAALSLSSQPFAIYMKDTSLDVFRIINSGLQALEDSIKKIKTQDIIPMTDVVIDSVFYSGDTVSNNKKINLEDLSQTGTMLDHTNQQLNSSLLLKPWDIGELHAKDVFKRVPSKQQDCIPSKNKVPEIEIDPGPTSAIQEIYSIWISYIQDLSFKSLLMTIMIPMPLFQNGFPEVEKDPGPLSVSQERYSISRLDNAYEYLIYFTAMMNNFRPWVAYIQDINLVILLITTMILLSSFQTKVLEVEIDPGPHQHYVLPNHINKSLTKIIIHGALVIFQTWIAYIHKFLSSYLSQLNLDSHVTRNFTSNIIPQHHSRNALSYTDETYLYHDHYMIPATKFQTPSNRNFNYYKYVYAFTWKGVSFKTLPFKIHKIRTRDKCCCYKQLYIYFILSGHCFITKSGQRGVVNL
jgi:hypothetical protein